MLVKRGTHLGAGECILYVSWGVFVCILLLCPGLIFHWSPDVGSFPKSTAKTKRERVPDFEANPLSPTDNLVGRGTGKVRFFVWTQ